MVMISVVCPIYNEEKYIEKCVQSILKQDYPKEDMEVLFVDGMSTDATREILVRYSSEYPWIRVLDNPHKIVPYAMNIGIKASKGDVIIRIDAHSLYEKNYFSALSLYLRSHPDVDNVGAVCKTDVLNKTPKTLAIREVLSNKFGVGNSTFRIGITEEQDVDTVPFGCWRKSVFDKYGLYDVRLVRNQDIELNKRICRGGGRIVIIPDTSCTYLARETFKSLSHNNYQNGRWNILTVYYTGQMSSLSLRHFVPLAFVSSLFCPLIIAMFCPPVILLSLCSLVVYIVVIGWITLKLSLDKKMSAGYLFLSFMTLHVSYGLGSLVGILSLPFTKK